MKLKIAPSILSANFGKLNEEIRSVEKYADMFHVDVMDGHFVPNITIGASVVACMRTQRPIDCHLMIEHPEKYIDDFAKAGAWNITVHAEACGRNLPRVIRQIKKRGVRAGVSINPKTSLSRIEPVVKTVDLALVMSVNPGFGGQKFISSVLWKIKKLRQRFPNLDIQIDGGINGTTAKRAVAAGANILVAGSYIFHSRNRKLALDKLRKLG